MKFRPLFLAMVFAAISAVTAAQTPGTSQYPTSLDTNTTLLTAVNNCSGVLSGGVDASQTSFTLVSTTCFPSGGGIFVIDGEYVLFTSKTSSTLDGLTRGALSSAGASHSSGVPVRLTINSAYHNVLRTAMIAVQTKLGTGTAIDASKIADGSVSSTEFQYINSLTSNAQTQIDGKVSFDINGLTAETVPASGDFIAIYDVSASALRKMTYANFTAGLSGSGATAALDNLASVNINTALLFQSGVDVGSTAKPARNLYLYGGGTYGTNYFKITGTPTGNRDFTLPDLASTTFAMIAGAQTISGKTFDNSNIFSGYFDVDRITAPSAPASGKLRFYANNTTGKMGCIDSSSADCMPSGGGAPALSAVTDPTGNWTLDMNANLISWTWDTSFGSSNAFLINLNNSTPTGNLLKIQTGIGNNAIPFTVAPRTGTAFEISELGNVKLGASGPLNSATSSFPYLPVVQSNSEPTGTPTSITGFAPILVEQDAIFGTYGRLWVYGGSAWRLVTPVYAGGTGTPTISGGSGAGTTPTVSVAGTNLAHEVTITTGTTPSASATVVTVTFNTTNGTFPTAPFCVFTPSNANANALTGAGKVYVGTRSTSSYNIDVGSTNLTASTQYKWNAHCMQ